MSQSEEIERNCACCGCKFKAKRVSLSYLRKRARDLIRAWRIKNEYEKFCSKCSEKIEVVEWFSRHKEDPTPEKLKEDLKEKIRKLQKLLTTS